MKPGVYALTLISLATSIAAAQPAPPPAGEPPPYPAPPPQQPQPTYPAPTYPQPQPYPQQYAPPPAPYAVPYAPMPEPTLDGPKHTGTGVLLSLGATLLPPILLGALANENDSDGDDDFAIGVLLTTALLGPSAGHLYANDFLTVGLGIRAASLAMILIGINADVDRDDEIGYIVIGTLGLIGGGIADIATVGGAVRDYNFEHAKKTLSPMVAPGRNADGTTHLRIGLTGSF